MKGEWDEAVKPRAVANPVKMSAEAGVKSTSSFPSVFSSANVFCFGQNKRLPFEVFHGCGLKNLCGQSLV